MDNITISSNGQTVWINDPWRCIARFCTSSGEIFSNEFNGKTIVIQPDWKTWTTLVFQMFNIHVSDMYRPSIPISDLIINVP